MQRLRSESFVSVMTTLVMLLSASAAPADVPRGGGSPDVHPLLAHMPDRYRRALEVVPMHAAPVKVVAADDGSPVTSATLALLPDSGPLENTTATHEGRGRYRFAPLERIRAKSREGTTVAFSLLVTAPGFVPETTSILLTERVASPGELTVRLGRGRPVTMEITREDGQPLPESLEPILADQNTLE